MKDKFNPLQQIVAGITDAASVVSGVAEKTQKHTEPIVVFAKDRMLGRVLRSAQLRIAKATFPYRSRMRWSY
jgi:hypothetical protein